jgi:hypothetical protein
MTEPNENPLSYQVGGDHYKKYEYQPIELFNDLRLDFNRANAIKYLARWRQKNGVEDLKKAVQYLRFVKQEQDKNGEKVFRFLEQFENPERRIIGRILYCETWKARNEIEKLIQACTDGQAPAEETPDADA